MTLKPLAFWRSPSLALGAFTFTNNRLATFESLLESLENRVSASTVTLQQLFEKWAARDKKRMESRHLVFTAIASRLARGGSTFAKALRPFVSNDEFLIIASGETNGDLAKALRLVVRNIQATDSMADSIASALAQPAIGVASVLMMSFGFGKGLWPDFLRGIPERFWPAWTMPCIQSQMWFATYWYSLFALFALVGLYYLSRDRWTGKSRDWADKLPPWSIYKGRQAANLLGVMSALIQSGRTVREAFVLVQDMSAPYMQWHMARIIMRYDVSGEDSLSSLKTGLFNALILDRIEDAAAGRDFGGTLSYVGDNALKVILRIVNRQAQASGLVLSALVGIAFFYIVSVSVFGIQDASETFIKTLSGAGGSAM